MWCRSVLKALDEYVHGTLTSRREAKIRAHLVRCEVCRREEEQVRLVDEALAAWPDVPPPEDGYHRLDSRLSFSLPPAVVLRPRRLRHLVAPYFAGVATAACFVLLVANPFRDEPRVQAQPPGGAAVAESTGLFPGERILAPAGPITVDTGDGYVLELPVDAATWRLLDRRTRERLLRGTAPMRTVDYEAK